MLEPTYTFGDLLIPNHPDRKCHLNFVNQWIYPNRVEDDNTTVMAELVLVPHDWMHYIVARICDDDGDVTAGGEEWYQCRSCGKKREKN